MAFQGMDPHKVEAVATALAAQAGAMEDIVATVDSLVRQGLHVWPGADAEDFLAWWANRLRPTVTEAAADVTSLATALRGEIAAQEEASEAGSGAGLAGPFAGVPRDTFAQLEGHYEWLKLGFNLPTALIGGAGFLAHFNKYGNYPLRWPRTVDFFKYNTSGILNSGRRLLGPYGTGIDKLNQWATPVRTVSQGLPFIDAAIGGSKIGSSLAQGQFGSAAVHSLETGAGIAKTSKNPIAYLAGMGTQAWVEVGKTASKADFSAGGFQLVIDEYRRDPWGSLTAGLPEFSKGLGRIVL